MSHYTIDNLSIKPAPGRIINHTTGTSRPYLEHVLICDSTQSMDRTRSWIDVPIILCHIDSISDSSTACDKLRSLLKQGKTIRNVCLTIYFDDEDSGD
jgi:hypothetical protein